MSTHASTGAATVTFVASDALIEALDQAAGERGETRSHYARKLLAQHLRDAGTLAPEAPATRHEAQRRARPQN